MALEVQRSKKSFPFVRIGIATLLLVLAAVTGWLLYRWYMYGDEFPVAVPALAVADPRVDEREVTKAQVAEHAVAPHEPRYVSVPSLGVDRARVFKTGLDQNNILGAPANISDVSWYEKSSTPGGGGVVLIDGHNGGITRNGVFAELHSLKQGDSIVIERGDGKVFRYEVRENESMPLDEVNATGMKKLMQPVEPGQESLSVITCDGKWVPRLQQFDRRIMLRAVLVA